MPASRHNAGPGPAGDSGRSGRRWLIACVGAVLAAFVYVHVRAYISYAGVELGMSRDAVLAHLGEPRRVEQQMIFCAPYFPWTGDCPGPRPESEFLFFKFGIDRWIVVGCDRSGTVWFKTLGDTSNRPRRIGRAGGFRYTSGEGLGRLT